MKALSSSRIGFLALVVFAGLAMGLFLSQPVRLFHWRELRTGNETVSRVETFRVKHGRLPETLKEAGIDDPDQKVFNRKMGSDEYCVWFGTTLGESETFNSRTQKWE